MATNQNALKESEERMKLIKAKAEKTPSRNITICRETQKKKVKKALKKQRVTSVA